MPRELLSLKPKFILLRKQNLPYLDFEWICLSLMWQWRLWSSATAVGSVCLRSRIAAPPVIRLVSWNNLPSVCYNSIITSTLQQPRVQMLLLQKVAGMMNTMKKHLKSTSLNIWEEPHLTAVKGRVVFIVKSCCAAYRHWINRAVDYPVEAQQYK